MNIGFIGVGSMGRAMIPLLVNAGHQLFAWNRNREALAGLSGVQVLDTPAAAFRQDVVISLLADDRAVRDVLLSTGALQAADTRCVHIVMSTLSPQLMEELHTLHQKLGVPLIAAPVFGVPAVAANGELNILAAGPDEAIAMAQPLFDLLGKKTWRLGTHPAQACIAKIAGNMMITQAIESLAEASALAQSYGLQPAAFIEVVTQTLFACPSYQRYGQNIVNGGYEPGFKLSLGLKDINLALDAADPKRLPLPAAGVVRSRMIAAVAQGLGDKDWSAFASVPAEQTPPRLINSTRDNAMNIETVLARLDALESRAAIESLISAYANAFDRMDSGLLHGIWHADATLDLPGFGSAASREDIMRMADNSWQQMPHMHHWMANPLIDIDGDSATATVAADCLFQDIEKGPVQVSGLYHDSFARRDGQWRFLSRRFELHYLTPLLNWTPIAGSEGFGAIAKP